jgi:hypothetical protein
LAQQIDQVRDFTPASEEVRRVAHRAAVEERIDPVAR